MPWILDDDGHPKYINSIYDKDCLPTWDEVYNGFWKPKAFTFDPEDQTHAKKDTYWLRPHRKLLLGWVCNQLNKIIFEDRACMKEINHILDYKCMSPFTHIVPNYNRFNYVKFYLDKTSYAERTMREIIDEEASPPPIYQCKLPKQNSYSIFKSAYPSIDIDTLDGVIGIYIHLINTSGENSDNSVGGMILSPVVNSPEYTEIIQVVISHIIRYFENGVGWKDKNGNLMDSKPMQPICQNGHDPAL